MRAAISEPTDAPVRGGSGLSVLRREAGRWWAVPLVVGVIWVVIAWLVLRADVTSLATVGVLVGITLLIAGVDHAAQAWFLPGGWRLVQYVLAAVFLLGALWAFVRPVNTFFALASVLGLILFLHGTFSIAQGVALRAVSPFWWLQLASGVLITLLGFWVSVSDRVFDLEGRTVFILVWVGFMALFRAFSCIAVAFSMLWFAKHGDSPEPDRAEGPSRRIPVPERQDGREAAATSRR